MLKARSKLFNVFLKDQNSFKFPIGVLLGLSFSIGVILSTVGLMDGFESVMKKALKNSVGDFSLISRDGFFSFDKSVSKPLKLLVISNNFSNLHFFTVKKINLQFVHSKKKTKF